MLLEATSQYSINVNLTFELLTKSQALSSLPPVWLASLLAKVFLQSCQVFQIVPVGADEEQGHWYTQALRHLSSYMLFEVESSVPS